jgi:Uma2 family endonuclease
MATILKLGPSDHGRKLSQEEFMTGDYQGGYKYEIIDGRLAVSPLPDCPENQVEMWLLLTLAWYARSHREVINYVTPKGRVFVPNREDLTVPEPDITAYRNFPLGQPPETVTWEEISPILVAEVLAGEPDKDLSRNVELFLQVPSIREYWVLDIRESAAQPTLLAHRRVRRQWRLDTIPGGGTYTTRLLPDFSLTLDIRR